MDEENAVKEKDDLLLEEMQSRLHSFRSMVRHAEETIKRFTADIDRARELRSSLARFQQQADEIAKVNANAQKVLSSWQEVDQAANRCVDSIREAVATMKAQEMAVKSSISTLRRASFLRGVGSIIDLFPDPRRYEEILPKETAEERLGEVWSRVGNHIRRATEVVSGEQQRKESG